MTHPARGGSKQTRSDVFDPRNRRRCRHLGDPAGRTRLSSVPPGCTFQRAVAQSVFEGQVVGGTSVVHRLLVRDNAGQVRPDAIALEQFSVGVTFAA